MIKKCPWINMIENLSQISKIYKSASKKTNIQVDGKLKK